MRRLVGCLLFVLCLVLLQPEEVCADGSFQINGSVLVKYTGSDSQIAIPDNVTEIDTNAFAGNTNITAVYFSNSVTTIGTGAFEYCKNLKYIVFTDSITTIGPLAFRGCERLESINLPGKLDSIGSNAFLECASLKTVTLPKSLSFLEYGAFAGCDNLTAINVDSGNPNFLSKNGVLYSADGKTLLQHPNGKKEDTVYVEEGIREIGRSAFYKDKVMAEIVIPDSVESIGIYAFKTCLSLTEMEIPVNVRRIEEHAFAECENLRDVYLRNAEISIGPLAFEDCPNVLLHAESGSMGQKYASSNGLKFEAFYVEETPTDTAEDEVSFEKTDQPGNLNPWRILLFFLIMTAVGSLIGIIVVRRKLKNY